MLMSDWFRRVLFRSCFFVAEIRGHDLPLARTMTVNTLVVLEIFYLFSVRYVHGTALTWRGTLGTRAVIIGVVLVVIAQLLFTYLPLMNLLFGSRPVPLDELLIILAVGVISLVLFEIEKRLSGFVAIRMSGRKPGDPVSSPRPERN